MCTASIGSIIVDYYVNIDNLNIYSIVYIECKLTSHIFKHCERNVMKNNR